jgi:hypothetical protein
MSRTKKYSQDLLAMIKELKYANYEDRIAITILADPVTKKEYDKLTPKEYKELMNKV